MKFRCRWSFVETLYGGAPASQELLGRSLWSVVGSDVKLLVVLCVLLENSCGISEIVCTDLLRQCSHRGFILRYFSAPFCAGQTHHTTTTMHCAYQVLANSHPRI